jgi:hypothetical protein
MSFPRPIQSYHSQADLILPYGNSFAQNARNFFEFLKAIWIRTQRRMAG